MIGLPEPNAFDIIDSLRRVIDAMGNGPIAHQPDNTGWWEAFAKAGLASGGFRERPRRGFGPNGPN